MLCNEYRMPSHLRLRTIIFWEGRCESGRNEINGVGADGAYALFWILRQTVSINLKMDRNLYTLRYRGRFLRFFFICGA
jgi:hypothetical protein